ncbi:uncharacterized protein Bfra_005381 [Botrytis fragariae]|uniref:LysM domain-containing protein n=1 Tax=Botrytis fragariae TaxID=1964551 RepID=A0A8H6EIW6_9HELO|nr:uncharacterized protein Bfra_005381 [Botrytis fragariae]KAF5873914.1 hypothetical protein Bfra_005381 [Botrytis fragariae]
MESNSSLQSTRSDSNFNEKMKEGVVFSEKSPAYDIKKEAEDTHWNEKERRSSRENRRLSCCGRIICGECIEGNERFGSYCPFCQVRSAEAVDNTVAASTPSEQPPSYESLHSSESNSRASPPTYSHTLDSKSEAQTQSQSRNEPQSEDTLHFLSHATDSMTSLSFRYGVPIDVLRKKNGITSDHLLLARKTILIPGEWYKGGVSLSPRPVEGEEEERRKSCVRRFMVGCKVSEYDIAVLYLEQANYDLELAMGIYKDDERWEKENPISDKGKGKGKSRYDVAKRRFTGQRS